MLHNFPQKIYKRKCKYMFPFATVVWIVADKQQVALILQSVPLNHRRRRNTTRWCHYKSSGQTVKRWKTWRKYDVSISFMYWCEEGYSLLIIIITPHRSSLTSLLFIYYHLFTQSVLLFLLFIHTAAVSTVIRTCSISACLMRVSFIFLFLIGIFKLLSNIAAQCWKPWWKHDGNML